MTRLPAPLTLTGSWGSGSVHAHGAHVMSWDPAGHDPVLWVSSRATDSYGSAIRGGIPVCFPWFGPGRTGDRTPSHGFARVVEWRRTTGPDPAADTAAVRFELTHEDLEPRWREAFPYGFRAVYTVEFGAELTASLEVHNTGGEAFDFEQALHTYLAVGDCRRIGIEGMDGVGYHDKVTGRDAVQSGTLRLTGETDRVFYTTGGARVRDPVLGRTLAVGTEGSATTVVWNPWREKAAGMADFGRDEWTGMVCVEAANVLDAAVTLAPGQTHVLSQRIAVERGSRQS